MINKMIEENNLDQLGVIVIDEMHMVNSSLSTFN